MGLSVFVAADGQVVWVFDGKYDQCTGTDSTHPDCQEATLAPGPGVNSGVMSCTENIAEYCG
ncbi:MAG: hypothetical protein IT292_07590 [Deltaproteobacteria bacterium]|nr:hypothetical protein [Deltaproteobacteria bacterium]